MSNNFRKYPKTKARKRSTSLQSTSLQIQGHSRPWIFVFKFKGTQGLSSYERTLASRNSILEVYIKYIHKVQVSERYSNYELKKGAQLHKTPQSTQKILSPISPVMFHAKTCQTYIHTDVIRVLNTLSLERSYSTGTEYYTEVHHHCFLRKRYSSWFFTQQVL
jgi:hypothetical protein